jgi:hypothetical protein
MRLPRKMLGGHSIGFRPQPIPANLVGLDWVAGVKTRYKKLLEFFLCSLEAGCRDSLHGGDSGVKSFLGGRIRTRVDDRLDALFLFRGKLDGHAPQVSFSFHSTGNEAFCHCR